MESRSHKCNIAERDEETSADEHGFIELPEQHRKYEEIKAQAVHEVVKISVCKYSFSLIKVMGFFHILTWRASAACLNFKVIKNIISYLLIPKNKS